MYTTHVLLFDHMMTKETRSAMLLLVENMVKLGNNKTYGNEEKNQIIKSNMSQTLQYFVTTVYKEW